MGQELYYMTYDEFEKSAKNILRQIDERNIKVDTIVPILRGGALLGNVLNNSLEDANIAYIHIRRSTSNETNAVLGTPVLKGITNSEQITGKHILIADDMLDRGVTMQFAIKELEKLKPASIHIAVLYNFTKLDDEEKYIVGNFMEKKKWIVFPWENKI